jgi:hypothetical protein
MTINRSLDSANSLLAGIVVGLFPKRLALFEAVNSWCAVSFYLGASLNPSALVWLPKLAGKFNVSAGI